MSERHSQLRINLDKPVEARVPRVTYNMDKPSRIADTMDPPVETGSDAPERRVGRLTGDMVRAALGEATRVPKVLEVDVVDEGVAVEVLEGLPPVGTIIRRVRPVAAGGDLTFKVTGFKTNPAGEVRITLMNDRGQRTNISSTDLMSGPVDGKVWRVES